MPPVLPLVLSVVLSVVLVMSLIVARSLRHRIYPVILPRKREQNRNERGWQVTMRGDRG